MSAPSPLKRDSSLPSRRGVAAAFTCVWALLGVFLPSPSAHASVTAADLAVAVRAQLEKLHDVRMSGTLSITYRFPKGQRLRVMKGNTTVVDFDMYRDEVRSKADLFMSGAKYRIDYIGRTRECFNAKNEKVVPSRNGEMVRYADDGKRSIRVDPTVRSVETDSPASGTGIWSCAERRSLDLRLETPWLVDLLSSSPGSKGFSIEIEEPSGPQRAIIVKARHLSGSWYVEFALDPVSLACRSKMLFKTGKSGPPTLMTSYAVTQYRLVSGVHIPTEWEAVWIYHDRPKGAPASEDWTDRFHFVADPSTIVVNSGLSDDLFTPHGMGATFDFEVTDRIVGETHAISYRPEEELAEGARAISLERATSSSLNVAADGRNNTPEWHRANDKAAGTLAAQAKASGQEQAGRVSILKPFWLSLGVCLTILGLVFLGKAWTRKGRN